MAESPISASGHVTESFIGGVVVVVSASGVASLEGSKLEQWVLLQMEFTGVRDDEQFLFESDTEEDFRRAVLCPPLDLKGMAQDGKGPVEKPAPKLAVQPAAQPTVAAEKAKGESGEPTAQCEANPTTGGDSAPDVMMHAQDASATDLEQPAKRAKFEAEKD